MHLQDASGLLHGGARVNEVIKRCDKKRLIEDPIAEWQILAKAADERKTTGLIPYQRIDSHKKNIPFARKFNVRRAPLGSHPYVENVAAKAAERRKFKEIRATSNA
jgi:hypothetical protein